MLNDNNTITVAACNVAALSFTYNARGKWVGTHWKREGKGKLPQSERAPIEASEAALYFNSEGVLDFAKCLALFTKRQVAYEVVQALDNRILAKRESELGPRPLVGSDDYGAYQEKETLFNAENNVAELDAESTELWSQKWDAEQMAVFAPAYTLQDISTKSELVAVYCDPVDGETGLERIVLDGLARDIKALLVATERA